MNALILVIVVAFLIIADHFMTKRRAAAEKTLNDSAEDALKMGRDVAKRRHMSRTMSIPPVVPREEDVTPVLTLVPRPRGTVYQEIRKPAAKKP